MTGITPLSKTSCRASFEEPPPNKSSNPSLLARRAIVSSSGLDVVERELRANKALILLQSAMGRRRSSGVTPPTPAAWGRSPGFPAVQPNAKRFASDAVSLAYSGLPPRIAPGLRRDLTLECDCQKFASNLLFDLSLKINTRLTKRGGLAMNATRSQQMMQLWYVTLLAVALLTGLSVVAGMLGMLNVLSVFRQAGSIHEVAATVPHSEPSR
jgi:hypothetical protein